jgi:predicted transglutaminase-like protease
MSNKSSTIILAYLAAGLFLIPILRYVTFFSMGLNIDAGDRFIFSRIFLSGPTLILIGIFLLVKFKDMVNQIFGMLFALIGTIWLTVVIRTTFLEVA